MSVTIKSGNFEKAMSMIGFGTLMLPDGVIDKELVTKQTKPSVEAALDAGYTHIDTAELYDTESGVGEVVQERIAAGSLKRENLFITTKLWCTHFERNLIVPTLKKSLERLQMDYVDLYLVHWPTALKTGDNFFPMDAGGEHLDYLPTNFEAIWRGMEECVEQGLTKFIGVSNFNVLQLKKIMEMAKIKPACNQIEAHVYWQQREIVEYCKENGIVVTAYCPVARYKRNDKGPQIWKDETILKIAAKHGKTPAQIALRFLIQLGLPALPKSVTPARIAENLGALEVCLDDEDMALLRGLDCSFQAVNVSKLCSHPEYPYPPIARPEPL